MCNTEGTAHLDNCLVLGINLSLNKRLSLSVYVDKGASSRGKSPHEEILPGQCHWCRLWDLNYTPKLLVIRNTTAIILPPRLIRGNFIFLSLKLWRTMRCYIIFSLSQILINTGVFFPPDVSLYLMKLQSNAINGNFPPFPLLQPHLMPVPSMYFWVESFNL